MAAYSHGSPPPTGEPSADDLIAGIAEFRRRLGEAGVSVRRFISSPRFMFERNKDASLIGTKACAEFAKLELWTGMLVEDVGYHTRLKDAPDKPFEVVVRDYLRQAGEATEKARELSKDSDPAAGLSSFLQSRGPGLISKAQNVDAGLGPRDPISDIIWVAEDLYSALRGMHKTFTDIPLLTSGIYRPVESFRDYEANPPVVEHDPRAAEDPTGRPAITKLMEGCATALLQPISLCNDVVIAARGARSSPSLELISMYGSQMATAAAYLETRWDSSRRVIDHARRLLAAAVSASPDRGRGREARATASVRHAAEEAFTAAARRSRDVSGGVAKLVSLIRDTGDAIDSL